MKNKLMTTMITMLTGGFALAASPNLFTCTGDGVEVGYATSSFVGQPTFSVKQGAGGSRAFHGRSIRSAESVLGKLVSVTKQAVPDLKVETYTLVVPGINLTNTVQEVEFDTVLIETLSRTSIGGPALVQGVLESSTYTPVKCKARKVFF